MGEIKENDLLPSERDAKKGIITGYCYPESSDMTGGRKGGAGKLVKLDLMQALILWKRNPIHHN